MPKRCILGMENFAPLHSHSSSVWAEPRSLSGKAGRIVGNTYSILAGSLSLFPKHYSLKLNIYCVTFPDNLAFV